jgi:hypothetical protein
VAPPLLKKDFVQMARPFKKIFFLKKILIFKKRQKDLKKDFYRFIKIMRCCVFGESERRNRGILRAPLASKQKASSKQQYCGIYFKFVPE